MSGDLIINGVDAYTTWGVSMGDNFIDAIEAPLSVKDYISNESRLEHGKRVITNPSIIRIASRDISLQFHIFGDSDIDYRVKKKAFEQMLYNGILDIQIPSRGSEIYHLIYLGKQITFAQTSSECKLAAKFEEPNPANRE